METAPVTCPSCFEVFEFALPDASEVPCELDYDCEVCCRPLVVECWLGWDENTVEAAAKGLNDD